MSQIDFHDIDEPAPVYDDVAEQYRQIESDLDAAASADDRVAAIDRWDALRRRLHTWEALTELRFNQDTRNEEYKKARDHCDELRPKLTDLAVQLKRRLVKSPHRAELEDRLGRHVFDLWEANIATYDPVIEQDMVREAKLEAEYVELLASAAIEFQGEMHNLSQIEKFSQQADRKVRHDAEQVKWRWFAKNRQALDRTYDEQVKLRTGMAKKLGFDDFTGLGYKRMSRIDYDRPEVEQYRAAIRQHVVPLAAELRRRQADSLSLDRLMYWDEAVFDMQGNPVPGGDHDWMLVKAQEMFDAMADPLGEFFRLMTGSHLLDLKAREGKAGGGFCTDFPSVGVPFIYANFNGTKGDVEVFTHEVGHAFQAYSARDKPLADYLWPTYESCEIHSMSLEFLTWGQMERFFGEDADRFRRMHLMQSLLFLPYGVAVDHYQHLVYSRPEATPAERFEMWQEMERTYMPWRDYGDLPHVNAGGRWQLQRHIYLHPFYYIDYTLAQTCALQFWVRSEQDFDEAIRSYVELCRRGGEAPFRELVRSANLTSPFDEGCLAEVVDQARQALDV